MVCLHVMCSQCVPIAVSPLVHILGRSVNIHPSSCRPPLNSAYACSYLHRLKFEEDSVWCHGLNCIDCNCMLCLSLSLD